MHRFSSFLYIQHQWYEYQSYKHFHKKTSTNNASKTHTSSTSLRMESGMYLSTLLIKKQPCLEMDNFVILGRISYTIHLKLQTEYFDQCDSLFFVTILDGTLNETTGIMLQGKFQHISSQQGHQTLFTFNSLLICLIHKTELIPNLLCLESPRITHNQECTL